MINNSNVTIVMDTSLGNIGIELYKKKAPITVANFLKYIETNQFDETSFFRILIDENQKSKSNPIHVIQGGLRDDAKKILPPITHENTLLTGCTHKSGTISMARKDVGTASGSFFICIGDQPSLDFGGGRQPDGQGFAAFGQVIYGMDIVHKIWTSGESQEYTDKEVVINSVRRSSPEINRLE